MSELFHDPCPVPLSLLGMIMPGCTYTFYVTGTTTLSPIYSNAALSSELENPLTSDASGRFPPIYLDSAVVYRVQLHDVTGALLYDVDPVHPTAQFPPGTLVLFWGDATARDAAYPPSLWQVCDGSNGSPDARDRFMVGVSDSKAAQTTGGTTGSVTIASSGAHSHTLSVDAHTLTTDEIPPHHHTFFSGNPVGRFLGNATSGYAPDWGANGEDGDTIGSGPYIGTQIIGDAGGGEGHTHTGSTGTDGAHAHTFTYTPPYYATWVLMRKS